MQQRWLFNEEDWKDIIAWVDDQRVPVRCRCGGAFIETGPEHIGPVHCGEEACELLPRLPQTEGFTRGDTRAIYDASITRHTDALLKR